jgi:putative phage-type endonuclease
MIIRGIEQGTDEWKALRAGRITASCMADVLAFDKKTGKTQLKARENYIAQIVAEILSGQPKDGPQTFAMRRGSELEAEARAEYEVITGNFVEQVTFAVNDELPFVGASPDGLVGTDGMIEIKCPEDICKHLAAIRFGMPEEHAPQVQSGMWSAGRQWCDFVSYHPDFPPHFRTVIVRVKRDESYIKALAEPCKSLWAEVQIILTELGGNRSDAVEGSPVVPVEIQTA